MTTMETGGANSTIYMDIVDTTMETGVANSAMEIVEPTMETDVANSTMDSVEPTMDVVQPAIVTDNVKPTMETDMVNPSDGMSTRRKVVKTVCLVLVWVCLGLFLEITGPTLIDLRIRTNSNYEAVASAVSGRSAGFFIGSVIGGVLVDKFGAFCELLVALSLNGGAAATIAAPWVHMTELLFFFTLLQGTFEGVINIAGQKLILNMWMEHSASPLQILHGGFGIGSFIIPLIANPFLADLRDEVHNNTLSNNTVTYDVTATTTPGGVATTSATETPIDRYENSRIEYAYMIAAAIAVAVSMIFFWYHFFGRLETLRSGEEDYKDSAGEKEPNKSNSMTFREMINPATCANGRLLYGLEIFVLVFLFFFNCVGGERVGGKFIRAFSIDYYNFSKDDGSYINTVFWICFSAGRVSAFVVARWVPIRVLIIIETGGALVSAILLVIFGTGNVTALWVLISMTGFFVAPLFPSGIAWANYHIHMTGISITVFLLGGSLGGIAYMAIIGYLYDHYGPKTFLYTLLGYAIAVFVLAILMDLVGAQHGNRFKQDKVEDNEIDIAQDQIDTKETEVKQDKEDVERY